MKWIKLDDKNIGLMNEEFKVIVAIKKIIKRSGGIRYKCFMYGIDSDISCVSSCLAGEWADIETLKNNCEKYFKS